MCPAARNARWILRVDAYDLSAEARACWSSSSSCVLRRATLHPSELISARVCKVERFSDRIPMGSPFMPFYSTDGCAMVEHLYDCIIIF
jgi:hypothetical protein